jgi:hypothetical protein
MKQKTHWPFRYDLLQRYRLIEIVALWEGKLNAGHLIDYFGIGRQQASKDINEYLSSVGPRNLVYNSSLKGYEPSETFAPKVTLGDADDANRHKCGCGRSQSTTSGHPKYGCSKAVVV